MLLQVIDGQINNPNKLHKNGIPSKEVMTANSEQGIALAHNHLPKPLTYLLDRYLSVTSSWLLSPPVKFILI